MKEVNHLLFMHFFTDKINYYKMNLLLMQNAKCKIKGTLRVDYNPEFGVRNEEFRGKANYIAVVNKSS